MTLARSLLAGTTCLFGLIVPPALGFGTINEPVVLGQHNEHEMITRLAFQCPSGQKSDGICFEPRSLDQLAGYHREVIGLPIPGGGSNGAVGAPDALDPVPEGPEAHCDDADYLDVPGYPQTRKEANAKLQACVDHLRKRFRQGVTAAEQLIDERNRVQPGAVELASPFGGDRDCSFFFPSLQFETFARPKCSAIEGFGRALHGVQDFYSHSNWADQTDTSRPVSASNPPGLGMNGTAPFLDLSAHGPIPEYDIPPNLTTGCFSIPDGTPGSGDCAGRITHHTLCKDHGVINLDGTFGDVGPSTPRSDVAPTNFFNAVRAAVQSSQEAWAAFRKTLIAEYGEVKGNLMICALVHDDPVKDCRTRTTVLAIDRSAKSLDKNADGTAYGVSQAITYELRGRLKAPHFDSMELIEFAEIAKVVSPMDAPSAIKFDGLDLSGKANVGRALELAINETIKAQPETYADRAAVVLLSTGVDPEEHGISIDYLLTQLQRAKDEGIRVHYGCLSVPRVDGEPEDHWNKQSRECFPGHSVIPAVLRTGGLFSYVKTLDDVRTVSRFVDLIMERGLVTTDELDPENAAIYPGIATADVLYADHPKSFFNYRTSFGENISIILTDRALEGQGLGGGWGCFFATLWDKPAGIRLSSHISCGTEPLIMEYHSLQAVDLLLVVELGQHHLHDEHNFNVNKEGTEAMPTSMGPEERRSLGGIVFTAELDTNMPNKHSGSTSTSSSIISAKETVEIPMATGTETEEFLTSETVDVIEETNTAEGGEKSSSTWMASMENTKTLGGDFASNITVNREQETGAMKGKVPMKDL